METLCNVNHPHCAGIDYVHLLKGYLNDFSFPVPDPSLAPDSSLALLLDLTLWFVPWICDWFPSSTILHVNLCCILKSQPMEIPWCLTGIESAWILLLSFTFKTATKKITLSPLTPGSRPISRLAQHWPA
ncbi:hypothetical protein Y1Q_0013700 [Alligator mississippiensis]|uniref:Uncharacterized protein n=1 Tax=Alligator mississippiensis TaxID=8496 RepID=A0A151P4M7_ALLMI|nr:hypothetical protein Y1Q_0013700 [Alligator mississippiensis]